MKRRAPAIDREAFSAEIAGLSKLGIDDLRERGKALFGKALSREIGRSFLTRAIAYHLQERAYGGLKPSTLRLLARVAEQGSTTVRSRKSHARSPAVGGPGHGSLD